METLYKNCRSGKGKGGFTMIEILVVVGILGVVLAFGMTINLSAFTTGTLQSEESKIVSVLERARSHAMANMCFGAVCADGKKHGVCYDPTGKNYVIFQDTCDVGASTSELIPANTNIATISNFATTFPTVVFNQLAGTTTSASLIIIDVTDGVKTLVPPITINNEGTINW